jgi:ParB family chromosome partitioning protein
MAAPKRTGLGRGIGALIPTTEGVDPARPVDVFFGQDAAVQGEELLQVPGARLANLDPADIVPNPRQPRTAFDEQAMAELVHSVREFGVMQPIVVREVGTKDGRASYEVVMGERRLRASRSAGLTSIPAVVKETTDDNLLRDALLENLHRSDLNPLDEASAYQQLLDDFGITQEQLAERIGRSRSQITNTLRVMKLPEAVQRQVGAGVLSLGHAKAILSAGSLDAMQRVATKIVNEDLSVRQAEAIATAVKSTKAAKPRTGGRQAQLDEIAGRLGDHLDTRVKISLGAAKGQLVIDFASVQDLNRILGVLGVDGYR